MPPSNKSFERRTLWDCMKSVRVWRFAGPYFPEFGLNMVHTLYLSDSIRVSKNTDQPNPNTDTFQTV